MILIQNSKYAVISLFLLFFVSCASNGDVERGKNPVDEERIAKYGVKEDSSGAIRGFFDSFGGSNSEFEGFSANNILWETALEKLSFMPLASVDKASGSIITDWHMIDKINRIKINFIIVNDSIDDSSINIRIFQESFSENQWVQVSRNTALEQKIKNSILSDASKLSAASQL